MNTQQKVTRIILLIAVAASLFLLARPLYRHHEVASLFSFIQAGDAAGVSRLLASHPELIESDLVSERRFHATPLSVAAALGQGTICSNLIALGANVNARDKFGLTPLHNAISIADTNMVLLLLQHGADVTAKTVMNGETPLDFTKTRTHSSFLRELLSDATLKATNR